MYVCIFNIHEGYYVYLTSFVLRANKNIYGFVLIIDNDVIKKGMLSIHILFLI